MSLVLSSLDIGMRVYRDDWSEERMVEALEGPLRTCLEKIEEVISSQTRDNE